MKLTTRLRDFISDHAPMFRRRSSTIQITPFIDRIPQELLLYIFQTIVNANPRKANVLIQVCSKWRNIALSSGSLWSRVILTYPIHPQQFTGVSARLARSGSYPLDILCDFRDPSWDWDEENHAFRWQEMEPVMRLLLVHVARWWRFELLTDTWSPIFTFLWYTRRVQDMPMLENISLSRCNLYFAARGHIFQPIALRQPIPLFGGIFLSKLKSVSLVGVHIDWQPPSLRNLTELTLKFQASDVMPTLPQFDTIFQACQGLLRLTIFGWGPIFNPSTPIANGQLRLPLLQYFSFGFLDIPYSLQLLSLFDFPSLNELILEDISKAVSPGELQDATDFMRWFLSTTSPGNLRRSNYLPIYQLQSLEIHSICSDERVMASFFRESASLKRLGLFDVPSNFLSLFFLQKDAVVLCPHLQELYCQDMDPAIVLEIVSSRISIGGLLKKATADFLREPRPSTGSVVHQKLRKLGINILVTMRVTSKRLNAKTAPPILANMSAALEHASETDSKSHSV